MPVRRPSRRCAHALLAGALLSLRGTSAGAGGTKTSSTGTALATHPAVLLARRFASERLGTAACRAIFQELADRAGRPLARRLDELGMSAREHLASLVFEDGDRDPLCHGTDFMAFTTPLSPIVHVCTSRFARKMQMSPPVATATILHEQLHTLGLGENPPTPREITFHVLARCGR